MELGQLLRRHGALRRRWLLAEVVMPPAAARRGRIRPGWTRLPFTVALPVRRPDDPAPEAAPAPPPEGPA